MFIFDGEIDYILQDSDEEKNSLETIIEITEEYLQLVHYGAITGVSKNKVIYDYKKIQL